MDISTKKKYIAFMQKQLSEMAKKVKRNSSKNQEKRENNIFLIFSDKNAKKYMGTGRSFASQLGTRLQKIAMFVARRKYGDGCVPNVIALQNKGEEITVSMISYPFNNGMSQKVYWTTKPVEDLLNKTTRMLYDKGSKTIIKKSFTDFIEVYKEAYALAKVEETVIG